MEPYIIDLVVWFVVFPLMLVAYLFIYRAAYQAYQRYKWQKTLEEVQKQNEEYRRKLHDYWYKDE